MKKILFTLVGFIPLLAFAQWVGDPASNGKPVCTASTVEFNKISVSDGAHGSILIISTENNQSQPGNQIRSLLAQRISPLGTLLWTSAASPIPVSIGANELELEHAIADGVGGVFFCFSNNNNIYVQHIDGSGDARWSLTGINATSNNDNNMRCRDARLCLDGSGGVIVYWNAEVSNAITGDLENLKVMAQRVDATGNGLWGFGGMQVCTASGLREGHGVVPDGAGGAIFFFLDSRNAVMLPGEDDEINFDNIDLFAQRVSASGTRLWTDDGKAICTNPYNQMINAEYAPVWSDGNGGAILFFNDYKNGNRSPGDLYAQYIDKDGVNQWSPVAVPVCTGGEEEKVVDVVPNGGGGVVVLWEDFRATFDRRLYVQSISNAGTTLWTLNGVQLFSVPRSENLDAYITQDGMGNIMVAWQVPSQRNIKIQKLGSAGNVLWPVEGVMVNSNPNNYNLRNPDLVASENGAVIVSFVLNPETATQDDIYAKRIEANGVLPLKLVDFSAILYKENVLLKWATTNEQNTLNFQIERSTNNIEFTYLATVPAAGLSAAENAYEWLDYSAAAGVNYYRLKLNDMQGAYTYSPVRQIANNKAAGALQLLGNPVGNEALLQFAAAVPGNVRVQVFDQAGKVVLTQQCTVQAGANQVRLITARLGKGVYKVVLSGAQGRQQLTMMKM